MNPKTRLQSLAEQWQRAVEHAARQETRSQELDAEALQSAVGLHLHTQLHAGTYYYFGTATPQPATGTHDTQATNLYYNSFRYY